MANTRHKRLEAEHNANDAFVKKQQAQAAKYAGKAPKLMPEAMEFNAYMCNNGMHAQELASKLTSDIDHVAFPVKKSGRDDS